MLLHEPQAHNQDRLRVACSVRVADQGQRWCQHQKPYRTVLLTETALP